MCTVARAPHLSNKGNVISKTPCAELPHPCVSTWDGPHPLEICIHSLSPAPVPSPSLQSCSFQFPALLSEATGTACESVCNYKLSLHSLQSEHGCVGGGSGQPGGPASKGILQGCPRAWLRVHSCALTGKGLHMVQNHLQDWPSPLSPHRDTPGGRAV